MSGFCLHVDSTPFFTTDEGRLRSFETRSESFVYMLCEEIFEVLLKLN